MFVKNVEIRFLYCIRNVKKCKLEKFNDEEITENEFFTLEECPHCHSKNLIILNRKNN